MQTKIEEYSSAMQRYHKYAIYHKLGFYFASVIVVMQLSSFSFLVCAIKILDLQLLFIALPLAYILTDLISGIVHMYMDNNVNYKSIVGPLIAAFHLHHKKPTYKKNAILKIYFTESGSKTWLVFYLLLLNICQYYFAMPIFLNMTLVLIGILSSVSEVSHYLCHNSTREQKLITLLQRLRILLPKKHHAAHHRADNINYCFLNGVADPLVNKIAAALYDGYKNNSDQHVLAYSGEQTGNRL